MRSFVSRYGIEFASGHIVQVAGPGEERNLMMMLAFKFIENGTGCDKAVALAKVAPTSEDRRYALAGIMQFLEREGGSAEELRAFLPLKKDEATDFGYTVQALVKRASLSLEEGVELLNTADPELSSKRLTEFLQSVAIRKSREVAEYCLKNLNMPPDVRSEALRACFYSELENSGPAGMAFAIQLGYDNGGKVDPTLLTDCMMRFYQKDARKAEDWLRENGASATGDAFDALRAASSIHSANNLNFIEAREVLSRLKNQEVVSKAERVIDQLEGESVRGKVERAPVDTMNDLTSGDSQHGERWINNAFGHWAKRSPEAAWKWYESNSDGLSPVQIQEISRVYVDQAIARGDIANAKLWAEKMVDPQYISSVSELISKAEGVD